jgi:hypothetical protein
MLPTIHSTGRIDKHRPATTVGRQAPANEAGSPFFAVAGAWRTVGHTQLVAQTRAPCTATRRGNAIFFWSPVQRALFTTNSRQHRSFASLRQSQARTSTPTLRPAHQQRKTARLQKSLPPPPSIARRLCRSSAAAKKTRSRIPYPHFALTPRPNSVACLRKNKETHPLRNTFHRTTRRVCRAPLVQQNN